MKAEVLVFGVTAAFFAVTAVVYGLTSNEPAGTVTLAVSFVVSTLITFYLAAAGRRNPPRPEDRNDAAPDEEAGEIGFFSPHSIYPVTVAFAVFVFAAGIAFGMWLALVGFCLLVPAVLGFVFEYYWKQG